MPGRLMRWLVVQTAVTSAVATIGVATVATRHEPAVDSLRVFAAAPAAATEAGTVRLRLTVTMSIQGRTVTEVMAGAFDIRARMGSMTLKLPAPMAPVRMVQNGNVFFASIAPSRVSLAQGRHWVSVDNVGKGSGTLGTQDPLAYLRLLAGAEGSVRRIGPARVDGQQTTHYRAHLSSRAVFARVSGSLQPQAAAALAAVGPTIPADAWVNTAGQLVRMTVRMTVEGMRIDINAAYTDYGAPVQVTLPQQSDVLAIADLSTAMSYVFDPSVTSP